MSSENGLIEFWMPPESMVKTGKARKLTGREWAYINGLLEVRRNPEGQDQTELYWTLMEERACRMLVEIDGEAITERAQILAAMNGAGGKDGWDAATMQCFTVLFRKLNVETDLDTFDFFGPPDTPEVSSA